MKLRPFVVPASSGLLLSLAFLLPLPGHAQSQQVITLDPPTGLDLQAHTMDSKGNLLPEAPANFRRLGEAHAGELADLHTLTLRFSQTTRVTGISVTKDFKIEQGGSCVEGNVYEKGSTCRLLVRFTPQGPGRRTGRINISNTASGSPTPFIISGFSYQPVISFIPSMISTVPGTYPSSVGLLKTAQNLAIDGGDTLYVADTGNNLIRMMDSSGKFTTISSGATAPWGVAADSLGEVFFSQPSTNQVFQIYAWETGQILASGTGTDVCTSASSPLCTLSAETTYKPGTINFDAGDMMVFEESSRGAAFSQRWATPSPNFVRLSNAFTYQTANPGAFAIDANDNLYVSWTASGNCQLNRQPLYYAEQGEVYYSKVAGGRICGYAGDGGLANNAEISSTIGQIAFDQAGDLYFADAGNQRIRRVDSTSKVIRTIAGNGYAGYTDDGSLATLAELSYPTGLAVDSQGQVYIISGTGSTSGGAQVIRKVTATGRAYFGNIVKGASASATVLVTNIGNTTATLTNAVFTGAAASDYSINPATTSCLLTPGSTLNVGASCQIGFTFTPSALGQRNASYTLLGNTVNGSNTIQMIGAASLPTATFKITSPTNGASFTSGTAVTFSVSVTSSSGPAPTGTVQFKVDGANYGSPVTISSGKASTSVTGLTTTTHSLSATYSGDSNYAAGGPISVSITITAVIAKPPIIVRVP